MHARELLGRDILPTVVFQGGNDHLLNGIIFVKSRCHIISSIICRFYRIKLAVPKNGLKTVLIGFLAGRLASLPRLQRWFLYRTSDRCYTLRLERPALQVAKPELPTQ